MESHLTALRARARSLPEAPGVYFWKDAQNKTLYIGKAVNLRHRVSSYFSTARRDGNVRQLLARARWIEYEVTSTELDALFRESALIKREQPPRNRALKQPVRLYYLKFDSALRDPYMEVARQVEDDGSLYFGPFRSAGVLRETMEYLHAVLPLRKCTAVRPRCKPCIYYQMKTCAAPLIDEEHRRRHQEAIEHLHDLLDGRSDRVVAWLERRRDRLSDALMFERAAEVQQRLDNLHYLLKKQAILDAAVQCRCVLICQEAKGSRQLLLVAHGQVVSCRGAEDATTEDVAQWVRAHQPVVAAIRRRQSELDAASVLERWLIVNRKHVRWVAIPESTLHLEERTRYVLEAGG
jgi:excinuclease ABC subunit C